MSTFLFAVSTGYPLFDAFLTILWVFLFVVWIFVLVLVIVDLFRSDDLSGWGKAGWLLVVLIFEVFGVLAYLIVRGRGMSGRTERRAQLEDERLRTYIRETAGASGSSGNTTDQLAKLADLRDRGVLTPDEFERQKNKILTVDPAEAMEAQHA